jgi:hypothetical protein
MKSTVPRDVPPCLIVHRYCITESLDLLIVPYSQEHKVSENGAGSVTEVSSF